ncbi:putative phosphorylase [Plectosphaerella cucumerina]|uniref:Phosphorylase n=1 Tax=Plectosphaerella cucumerina TaxID=40658 RepID=A0A8K0WZ56_9PEZI|nr:putative phosphorylase [Plectosphaerella cucumerina]
MLNVVFDEAEALRRFDKLVELGIMKYADASTTTLIDDGFPFTIRICSGWSQKPAVVGASSSTSGQQERFGPGSDINNSHPDQTVGQLNDTHLVVLNIFPAFRPQYLLLTLDSYRSQYEPLHFEDISASWAFLQSLQKPHIALYNCTPAGGFRLFPDNTGEKIHVPYAYFLHRFTHQPTRKTRPTSREVFDTYNSLLAKARQHLGNAADDSDTPCPHNIILLKDWILVIPRRPVNNSGFMTNAAGMMGMIITSTEEQAQKWLDKGVSAALAECGIPPQVPEN